MSQHFEVVSGTSLLIISARSSVGNISWSTRHLEGSLTCTVVGDTVDLDQPVTSSIVVPIESLSAGNASYDAELRRRIDSRTYPTATIGLDRIVATPDPTRFVIAGTLDFHGVQRAIDGVVTLESITSDRVVLSGEQTVDIRDFGIATPTVLRMRIYPDVRLTLLLEATSQASEG